MNIYEFFTKLTHFRNKNEWVEATGTFTGKTKNDFRYGKYGSKRNDFNSYELIYYTNDKECHSWYSFYPLPGPDAEELTGTTMRIRYKKSRPWIFEQVLEEDENE